MKEMEQIELDAYRNEIESDMSGLFEKYRRIFDWDIPDINEPAAVKLILAAMQTALDNVATRLAG